MAEVRLRAAADADLASILDYSIERFGEEVGEAYLASFGDAFNLLGRHPMAGALRTEIQPPIRSLSHRNHRIFYDVEDGVVWIVRVLHHAMDVEGRLSE